MADNIIYLDNAATTVVNEEVLEAYNKAKKLYFANPGSIHIPGQEASRLLEKAREQILEVHARKKRLADNVDLKTIAKNTSGFSGADLENVLNEAALLSARKNLPEIGMSEIEDAMVKVTMGPEKRTRVRSEKEQKLVAYH